jgi:hypothetical protein
MRRRSLDAGRDALLTLLGQRFSEQIGPRHG